MEFLKMNRNHLNNNKALNTGGGYKSVVSLGHFCGPAQELERKGFRSFSLPFDWLIVEDFKIVLSLIENHFSHFLLEEDLVQEINVNPNYYYDSFNGIHYYHDFNANEQLSTQLPAVREKYLRRIERFYQVISEPCLFIRYCTNQEEYYWIRENYNYILNILKKFHAKNNIIYVCNEIGTSEQTNGFFFVQPDKNDSVNRRILRSSKALSYYISVSIRMGCYQRIHNLKRYYKSQLKKKKRSIVSRLNRK